MADARLSALEERIGYAFRDRELLARALTHASHGDGRKTARDYERLEFLGDRVLGLIIARRLFERFDDMDEGGLAPRLNALVRKEACARVARRIALGEAVRMSRSEEKAGGRDKESILGDACEALLAAIYLDGGLRRAQTFVTRFWAEEFAALKAKPKDPKTKLQEWAQARRAPTPRYEVTGREGPDHRPRFEVEAVVEGLAPARGEGASRRAAERAAAAAFLAREGVDG
ncbi:MAG: ribonuclease III [Caulobacterales bacterium]|nr:ribonuclease III [Caulobacterales bacterium]